MIFFHESYDPGKCLLWNFKAVRRDSPRWQGAEGRALPIRDLRHVTGSQPFDGSVDLEVLLQGDVRPEGVDLGTVAHTPPRVVFFSWVWRVVS